MVRTRGMQSGDSLFEVTVEPSGHGRGDSAGEQEGMLAGHSGYQPK